MDQPNNIRYLNLDVLLESEKDLTALVQELGDRVFALCCDQLPDGDSYFAFEPPAELPSDSPQEHAIEILSLIEGLSPEGRSIWDSCFLRVFDFGFESGHQPICVSHDLSSETLRSISALGGQMRISIYGVPEPPNRHIGPDQTASGLAGHPER